MLWRRGGGEARRCVPWLGPLSLRPETALTSERRSQIALANCLRKRTQNPDRELSIHWPGKIILHSTGSHPALDPGTVICRDIRNQRARRPALRLLKQPAAATLLYRVIIDNHDRNSRPSEIDSRLACLDTSQRAPGVAQSFGDQRKNRLVPGKNHRRSSGFSSRRMSPRLCSFMRWSHAIPCLQPCVLSFDAQTMPVKGRSQSL
jgi:hypothetical protein